MTRRGDAEPSRRAWSTVVVDRRRLVLLAWLIVCALLAPLARQLDRRLVPAGRVPGSEAEHVERTLAARFGSPFARYAVLVVGGLDVTSAEGRDALRRITVAIDTLAVVSKVVSPLTAPDTLLVGTGGRGAIVLVGLEPRDVSVGTLVSALRDATAPLASRLAARRAGITLRWTGEDPLNLDLRRASSDDVRAAELRALPVTALLLWLAFGGVAAALLPIGAGVLAIVLSLGVGALIAARQPTSLLYSNVVSLLGLSLGIDYALLVVSRMREATRDGLDAAPAAASALTHAGRTVALSGLSVAVGFGSLLVVPLDELRSVGAGGLVVTAASVLLATTLLPGALGWLGARVGRATARSHGRADRSRARWLRWGTLVTAHPWLVLAVAAMPLAALAWQVRRMRTALPSGDWLPARAESALAFRDLERMHRAAALYTVRVLLVLPPGVSALSPDGWRATGALSLHVVRDPRIAHVRSLPALANGAPLGLVRAILPDSARRIYVSRDSSIALVEAIPRANIAATETMRFVRTLRHVDAAAVTGVPGARLEVGGLPAFNADYEDVLAGRFALVASLVLGGTLVALLVGFRSVLVPLKAIAMNLLTVGAACGAVVLTFQDGHGAALLGLTHPLDAVFPTLPILVFCAVFGISMDYEVFLIARVAESRRAGAGESEAIVAGVAATGGVITSAAAIMIVVFGAFALGDFLPTKMLGFALGVAVLVDATLVRLAIGPALLRLAGRWNWWPGDRAARRSRLQRFASPPDEAASPASRLPAPPEQERASSR